MYRVCLQCGGPGFDPWVWKIPWRSEWLPTPVLLPGEFRRQRSLVGYTPWGHEESDMTERLTLSLPVAVRDETEAFHCLMILSEFCWSLCLQSFWTCRPSVTAGLKLSSLQPSCWGSLFPPPPHILCDGLRLSQAQHVSHTTPSAWEVSLRLGAEHAAILRGSPRASGEAVSAVSLRWTCYTWPPPASLPPCHGWSAWHEREDAPRRPFRVKTGSTPCTCSADHPLSGPDASLLRSAPPLLPGPQPVGILTSHRDEDSLRQGPRGPHPCILRWCSIKVCGRNGQANEGKMHHSGFFVLFFQ